MSLFGLRFFYRSMSSYSSLLNRFLLGFFVVGMVQVTAVEAFAQFSNERITLGILKGRGFESKGETPSGFKFRIEFLANEEGDLILDAFLAKDGRSLSDGFQRFEMSQQETNQAFPKGTLSPEERQKYFSQDGMIYLVQQEKLSHPQINLVFIEISKERKIRLSFHYGVQENFRSGGVFTEEGLKESPNPSAGKVVITTDWMSVED